MDEKDNKDAINHLEKLREDIRDEIKKRIGQRDNYSISLTIASGTIMAIAFSASKYKEILIALPLISIYFTVLIMYSYEIHRLAAKYLREEIEPRIAKLCETPISIEWETYYRKNNIPGIRSSFFLMMMIIISVFSLGYLWYADDVSIDYIILKIFTIFYTVLIISIIIWQYRKNIMKLISRIANITRFDRQ
jgi:hypothetical protein